MRVHHLAVIVEDLERAERFYRGVLGLEVIERWTDDAGRLRSLWVALGPEAFLAIERDTSDEPRRDAPKAPGWHCVALRIAKAEREPWRQRLAQAGHPVERESAYTLYTRDPDGNLVGLSHHPEPI